MLQFMGCKESDHNPAIEQQNIQYYQQQQQKCTESINNQMDILKNKLFSMDVYI